MGGERKGRGRTGIGISILNGAAVPAPPPTGPPSSEIPENARATACDSPAWTSPPASPTAKASSIVGEARRDPDRGDPLRDPGFDPGLDPARDPDRDIPSGDSNLTRPPTSSHV